jgi:hypothetical protein
MGRIIKAGTCEGPPEILSPNQKKEVRMRFSRFMNGKAGWSIFLVAAALMLFITGSEAAMRQVDFDGDGFGDLAVYRQSEGAWYIQQSSGGPTRIPWGDMASSDIPVAGDYDNDAITDAAVWRPTNGTWYIKNSSGGSTVVQWGDASLQDMPVPGDYDGDGKTDIAVYRQSTGTWYILNSSGGNTVAQWGDLASNDRPVPGDYDGDGKDDIAVWRGSTGTWYVKNSSGGNTVAQWGDTSLGDWVMPGDYDGDGKTDFAVWRTSTGTWYIKNSSGGSTVAQWGDLSLADVPMPVYSDTDNRQDIAVWRRTNGTWYVKQSTDGLPKVSQFGDASEGDIPITGFIRPTVGDKMGIYARFKELTALYAASLPDNTTLDPFFHPGFQDEGSNKADEIAAWSSGTEGPAVGWSFSHLWVQYLEGYQYLVGFQYSDPSGGSESVTLRMAKNGTTWTMYGDQTPIQTDLSSTAIRWISSAGTSTYFNGLVLWASDGSNLRPDIQSIKATGPGLPPSGILMNRDLQGWFPIAGTGDLYALDDAMIDALGDIGSYTFQYYSGTDGSGTLLNSSNQYLRKRPIRSTELSDASYPTLVSPTSHGLSAANPGGVLNVSWTNPPDTFPSWANLRFDQSQYNQYNFSPTQTSTSFDSTGIPYTPTWGELQIGIRDRYERRYELNWWFQ